MRRKTYGSYQVASCPFCGDRAYAKNKQGVAVCAKHKKAEMGEMQCACGEYLEIKDGKWGTFFLCPDCGPVSMSKALSVNKVEDKKKQDHNRYAKEKTVNGRKETVVRSDDPNYFD